MQVDEAQPLDLEARQDSVQGDAGPVALAGLPALRPGMVDQHRASAWTAAVRKKGAGRGVPEGRSLRRRSQPRGPEHGPRVCGRGAAPASIWRRSAAARHRRPDQPIPAPGPAARTSLSMAVTSSARFLRSSFLPRRSVQESASFLFRSFVLGDWPRFSHTYGNTNESTHQIRPLSTRMEQLDE